MIRTIVIAASAVIALPLLALGQSVGDKGSGVAAVYTDALDGHVTASGQTYDKTKLTAAHKTLPFGTQIKLTNPKNHRSAVLVVNDRGPVQADRMFDITSGAAAKLGISPKVMREVDFEIVKVGNGKTTKQKPR